MRKSVEINPNWGLSQLVLVRALALAGLLAGTVEVCVRMGSERFARQQQAFARPLPPDRVPDLVLLTVLSCPFYGVTPTLLRADEVIE